jgi:DNA-binding response OmpR family regulator
MNTINNPKILIVEDEVDIREALADMFTQYNFQVYTATNGKEGLDVALQEHPDVILLDINMPIMDGHETLRHLRADEWGKDAKVVVLSALDDIKNIAEAHDERITKYIVKAHTTLAAIVSNVNEVLYNS